MTPDVDYTAIAKSHAESETQMRLTELHAVLRKGVELMGQLVFATFQATLDALIASAIKEGKYDAGVGDIVATSIGKTSDEVVWTDPVSRSVTRLIMLE
ncbi:hypothetical protein T492DRAFT_865941, partial [Pavlovales sp. CCMP2436]